MQQTPYFSVCFQRRMEQSNQDLLAELKSAVQAGRTSQLHYLLKVTDHVDLDELLSVAARYGHSHVVAVLLEAGATARFHHLMDAVKCGFAHVMEIILEGSNGSIDVQDEDDRAMIFACHRGYLRCARLLLHHGANVDARDGEPLSIAVHKTNVHLVDLLLEYDAEITPNVVRHVVSYGHLDILRRFFDKGISLFSIDYEEDDVGPFVQEYINTFAYERR
jgi:ankyrin repeat protein